MKSRIGNDTPRNDTAFDNEDMTMENDVKKPLILKILLALMWAGLILFAMLNLFGSGLLALLAGQLSTAGMNGMLLFGCVSTIACAGCALLLLYAALLVALGHGRNWARVSLIVSNVFCMIVCLACGLTLLFTGKIIEGIGQGVQFVLSAIPVGVLLLPPVRRWFKTRSGTSSMLRSVLCCLSYWILSVIFGLAFSAGIGLFVWKAMSTAKANPAFEIKFLEFQVEYLDDAAAMYKLGEYHLHGLRGLKKDPELAFGYYVMSAEQDFRSGLNGLAQCYEHGWGTEKDPEKAYEYYLKAYGTGSVFAMNALGDCCEKGIGTETNFVKAIEWWTKAAEKNHDWAACKVALRHQKDKKNDEAFTWFRKAADIGSDYACCKLGECYERGWGTETNAVEAAKWFIKGAERRHPRGMEKAGDFYAAGYGVEKDTAKAREWYEKAVKRNGSKNAAKKLAALKEEPKKESVK